MKKKIIILKGLPASGKSSFANNTVNNSSDTVRINKDDIRKMLGGTFTKEKEAQVVQIRDMSILSLIEGGYSVIVDDCNLNPKHEVDIRYLVGDKADIEIVSFLDVPLEECLKRDRIRPERVSESVIMDMYRKFIKPIPVIEYNPALTNCTISDLDGTLAIKGDRDIYDFSKIDVDKLNITVSNAVSGFMDASNIGEANLIIVSGRDDSCKEATLKWLNDYGIFPKEIYMREIGDKRPDYIVKQEIYDTYIKDKYNVSAVFDDRDSVVRMWRDNGLPVFQVNEGNF